MTTFNIQTLEENKSLNRAMDKVESHLGRNVAEDILYDLAEKITKVSEFASNPDSYSFAESLQMQELEVEIANALHGEDKDFDLRPRVSRKKASQGQQRLLPCSEEEKAKAFLEGCSFVLV